MSFRVEAGASHRKAPTLPPISRRWAVSVEGAVKGRRSEPFAEPEALMRSRAWGLGVVRLLAASSRG